MIQWYREENGDFMAVDMEGEHGQLTARVACIEGLPTSMCTSTVSRTYLEECCAPVRLSQVPEEWRRWGNLEPDLPTPLPYKLLIVGDIDPDIDKLKRVVALADYIVGMGDIVEGFPAITKVDPLPWGKLNG